VPKKRGRKRKVPLPIEQLEKEVMDPKEEVKCEPVKREIAFKPNLPGLALVYGS
jgi:hypothetical protein